MQSGWIAGVLAVLAGAGLGRADELELVSWQTDLAQARQTARAAGRPLLVVFRCEH
jgi:hypothetical protein